MIYVKSEAERIEKTVEYVKKIIEEIDYDINDCDYIEDINGKRQYFPNAYAEERRALVNEKYKFEKVLNMLTMATPFHIIPW